MTRTRDAQRAAVYAAEDQVGRILDRAHEFPVVSVAGSRITLPVERHFGDIDSVQRYVDGVLALAWVRAQWPRAATHPVNVRERRGHARAHYEPDTATIAMPLAGPGRTGPGWALRELVVLHELAHHLGNHDNGATIPTADARTGAAGGADASHGEAFTGRLCELVDGVIGPEAAFLLRVSLADQGVGTDAAPS